MTVLQLSHQILARLIHRASPVNLLIALLTFYSFLRISGFRIDADIKAPNGYQVFCDKSRDCVVLRKNEILVLPEVDKYAVRERYLIGHRVQQLEFLNSRSSTVAKPLTDSPKPSYFIVDTTTGSLRLNLDKAQWLKELARLKIKDSRLQNTPYGGNDSIVP